MDKKILMKQDKVLTLLFLVSSFLYITKVINPFLWFHEIQPVFLLTFDFFASYLSVPGGFSEWLGNFVMQYFYLPIQGSIMLFLVSLIPSVLIYFFQKQNYQSSFHRILPMFPLVLFVTLASSYYFPFSVFIAISLVALFLLPLKWIANQIYFLVYFLVSAVAVFYLAGSGFLWVFSISAIIVILDQSSTVGKLNIVYISLISFLIIWFNNSFVYTNNGEPGYFKLFGAKESFDYKPGLLFYAYIFSTPLLLIIQKVIDILNHKSKKNIHSWIIYPPVLVFLLVGYINHNQSFNSDKKKVIESDYYCYRNDINKTKNAAMSTGNYDFSANINYNLSIMKAGKLTEDFFSFYQISGTDGLYPDKRSTSKMTVIATDFYYELGDIMEAKYWALESLKKHPYSRRVLQKLVKIELITGNYNEAKKYLNMLDVEMFNEEFVTKYVAYLNDSTLLNSDTEIIEKRNFFPGFTEVPESPLVRFRGLLDANPGNKTAFECMMLYYLLSGDLEQVAGHYYLAADYFDSPVNIYEEAILMYGATNKISVADEFNISEESINRLKRFVEEVEKWGDRDRVAMNEMFFEYGDSYLFYYYFILPQISMPDYAREELKQNKDPEKIVN